MQSSSKSFDIDILKLISEVKSRRALYDTSSNLYRDRCHKKKLWDEVCKDTCSHSVWEAMSIEDRLDYANEIQKRWNSLRSCFRRDLNIRNNANITEVSKKKKRKYYYFDSLLFLLPFIEKLKNVPPSVQHEIDEQDSESLPDPLDNNLEDYESDSSPSSSMTRCEEEIMVPIANIKEENQGANNILQFEVSKNANEEKQFIERSKTNSLENVSGDGDEEFLKSLLPTLKEFTSDQKLLLRIEIMRTILKFKQSCKKSN